MMYAIIGVVVDVGAWLASFEAPSTPFDMPRMPGFSPVEVTHRGAMLPPAAVLILPLLMMGIVGFAIARHWARARESLSRWADEAKLEIIDAERRWWRRGPFQSRTGRWQSVYRVIARASDGVIRRGWACVGGRMAGPWNGQVMVEWDQG
ncbi:MAG: hypothetical protein NTW19_24365 [Planctomycetota bacterium]|nr:hypothetical protein [Planctomycetota bacterium]